MSHDLFGSSDVYTPDGHDVGQMHDLGGHFTFTSPDGSDLAHSEHFEGLDMLLDPSGHELATMDHQGNISENGHIVGFVSHGHQAGHESASLHAPGGQEIAEEQQSNGGFDITTPGGQALFHLQRFGK